MQFHPGEPGTKFAAENNNGFDLCLAQCCFVMSGVDKGARTASRHLSSLSDEESQARQIPWTEWVARLYRTMQILGKLQNLLFACVAVPGFNRPLQRS